MAIKLPTSVRSMDGRTGVVAGVDPSPRSAGSEITEPDHLRHDIRGPADRASDR
jgi:hypothetical protein